MTRIKLCIPFSKPNLKAFPKACSQADMLEFWFDQFTEEQIDSTLKMSSLPVLYKHQGCRKTLQYVSNKVEYIDFDLSTNSTLIDKYRSSSNIIISYHNFKKTPSTKELHQIKHQMQTLQPEILKFAVQANTFSDSIRLLEFSNQLHNENIPHLAIAMGENGSITRKVAHLFSQEFTFVVLNEKAKTADGQLEINKLKSLHELI